MSCRSRSRFMDFCLEDTKRALRGQTPLCGNARCIYEERIQEVHAGGTKTSSDKVALLMNLLQAVFEMP